jgi:hypothetical protein
MFQKNFDCLQDNATPAIRQKSSGSTIDIRVCRSGDVLIKVDSPKSSKFSSGFKWIEMESFKKTAYLIDFLNSGSLYALSGEGVQIPKGYREIQSTIPKIICRWKEDRFIFIRYQLPTGLCQEEQIDILTGTVTSKKPVDCKSWCEGFSEVQK